MENVAAQPSPRHPICYDSYCLCDLSRDEKLDSFSVALRKEISYLDILKLPLLQEIGKRAWESVKLSKFLEGCEFRR